MSRRKKSRRGPRLTRTQVIAIRKLAAKGNSYRDISKIHRVTPDHVGRIVRGEVWRELGGQIKEFEAQWKRRGSILVRL